jgi:membrane protease subunit HflK
VLALMAGVLLVWLALGVSTVPQGEQGVIVVLGRTVATVKAGMHWYPPYPLGHMVIVDTATERRHQLEGSMLTRDGQLVNVALTVAYRIDNPQAFLFATSAPEVFLGKAVQATVLRVLSGWNLDDLLEAPLAEIKQQLSDGLQRNAALPGIGLGLLRLVEVRLGVPREVASAYDAALQAHAMASRQVEEARTSYATQSMSRAEHKASALLQEAQRDHAEQLVTARQRLALFESLLPTYQSAPQPLLRWLSAARMQQMAVQGTVVVDGGGKATVNLMPSREPAHDHEDKGLAASPAAAISTSTSVPGAPQAPAQEQKRP